MLSGSKAGMAHSEVEGRRRATRRSSYGEFDDEPPKKSSGKERVTLDREIPGVRRVRIERLDSNEGIHRPASHSKMTSESYATLPSEKSATSHRRRRRHHSPDDEHHRRRRESGSPRDESPSSYLYGTPSNRSRRSRATAPETRKLDSETESSESEVEVVEVLAKPHSIKERPRKRKIKIRYIEEEDYRASKPKERTHKGDRKPKDVSREKDIHKEDDSIRRSRSHRPRRTSEAALLSPPKRYTFQRCGLEQWRGRRLT